MDWNVFFSTLSQTCGAVVGIFSAFLITKIIADQAEFSRLKDKVSEMTSKSDYLKAHFSSLGFDELNKQELKEVSDYLYDSQKDSELHKEPEHYNELVDQPLYASKSDVIEYIKYFIQKAEEYQLEQKKKKEDEEQKKAERQRMEKIIGKSAFANMDLIDSFTPKIDHNDLHKVMRFNDSLQNNLLTNKSESSARDQLIIDASHQISLNKKLLTELQGSNTAHQLISRSLIIVLILFYIGVIYPLSFLPTVPGVEIVLSITAFFDILFSLKGILLGLLTVSFSFLIATFWAVNNRLKLSIKQTKELKRLCYPEGFSIYLKNYFDNKK